MVADDLKHHTLLTHDQEIELARRIQCGDADALDELVRHNLRLVYKIARRYYTNDPGTDSDDLVQQGMIGLLTAARRYDPDRHTRFTTYAFHCIRSMVQRTALTAGTIPRDSSPHRQPAVKPATIRARAIRQAPIVRLDAFLRDRRGDDSDNTLMDILADDSLSVEEQVLSDIEVERIISKLHLTERGEATVRDWLSGYTREEAGKRHGLSRSWIDTRLRVSNSYHFKEKIMSRINRPATCMEPGCDQPLYITANGTTLPRCEEHQKQYWREAQRAKAAADRTPHTTHTPLPKQSKVKPQPSTPLYEMERESGNGESPADKHFIQQPIPTSFLPQGEGSDCTCPDCIYREIVSLLIARDPRIAKLVEAMQTERQLRDELGT